MKEELDKIEEALDLYQRLVIGLDARDGGLEMNIQTAGVALKALSRLRPDIEEGLKLLAIKRLQDAADDGNSGFITPMER